MQRPKKGCPFGCEKHLLQITKTGLRPKGYLFTTPDYCSARIKC